jgi:hypothetical protein
VPVKITDHNAQASSGCSIGQKCMHTAGLGIVKAGRDEVDMSCCCDTDLASAVSACDQVLGCLALGVRDHPSYPSAVGGGGVL